MTSISDRTEICVLGAGLTGATAALELARAGADVVLLDQDPRPVNRASLRNEGKIHLGFVFAKDDTLATPDLMLEGALSFRRILSGLLGDRIDTLSQSTPFTYLVAEDSLVSPADLETRYAAIERLYTEKLSVRPSSDYLGHQPASLFRRMGLDEIAPHLSADRMIGAFQTEELAVDTAELAEIVRHAVAASPRVRFKPNHMVASVGRQGGKFRISGTGPEGDWRIGADQVVNALWDRRREIDRTVGIEPLSGWVLRLKHRVIARVPDRLRGGPSVTMVLGPYGDAVIWPNGTAYFSWYPSGLKGWTHAISPPESWNAPCTGDLTARAAASISRDLLSAVDRWYPGAAEAEPLLVDAGAIVAYGRSDVDDPASGLHDRTREVGVSSFDGYHTVDPGKLTTAPMFGQMAAARVMGVEAVSG